MSPSSISISRSIKDDVPQELPKKRVASQEDLFVQRSALIYTPTDAIPSEWIGQGSLDIVLPLVTPSYYEYFETRYYQTPRLWLDLIQRATGKLRWTSMNQVEVTVIRYDAFELPYHALVGAKALIDALKVRTSGRADGRWLHYFGAILDDGPLNILNEKFLQEHVSTPALARTRVIVNPV